MDKTTIREVMQSMGRKGGKASGKARMTKLTPAQRSAIAKKAAAKSAEVRSKKAAAKKKTLGMGRLEEGSRARSAATRRAGGR